MIENINAETLSWRSIVNIKTLQKSFCISFTDIEHSDIRRSSLWLEVQLYMNEPHSFVPTRTLGTPYSKLPGTWLEPQRRHLDVSSQFSTQCLVCFMLEKTHFSKSSNSLKCAVTYALLIDTVNNPLDSIMGCVPIHISMILQKLNRRTCRNLTINFKNFQICRNLIFNLYSVWKHVSVHCWCCNNSMTLWRLLWLCSSCIESPYFDERFRQRLSSSRRICSSLCSWLINETTLWIISTFAMDIRWRSASDDKSIRDVS